MSTSVKLVVFELEQQRYALHLPEVKKVIPAVEVTPLPKAPEAVLGIINMHGQIIPVFNIRNRFRLPAREVALKDQLIIARTARYTVALLVDAVTDIIEHTPQEITDAAAILPAAEYVEGVVKLENGMVLIHDLDTFLSLDEEKILNDALKEGQTEKDRVPGNGTIKQE